SAERSTAVRGLPNCEGAANGFVDGRREAARGEFSPPVRPEDSKPHLALRVGHAHRPAAPFGGAGAARRFEQGGYGTSQPSKDPAGTRRARRQARRAAADTNACGSGRIPAGACQETTQRQSLSWVCDGENIREAGGRTLLG